MIQIYYSSFIYLNTLQIYRIEIQMRTLRSISTRDLKSKIDWKINNILKMIDNNPLPESSGLRSCQNQSTQTLFNGQSTPQATQTKQIIKNWHSTRLNTQQSNMSNENIYEMEKKINIEDWEDRIDDSQDSKLELGQNCSDRYLSVNQSKSWSNRNILNKKRRKSSVINPKLQIARQQASQQTIEAIKLVIPEWVARERKETTNYNPRQLFINKLNDKYHKKFQNLQRK